MTLHAQLPADFRRYLRQDWISLLRHTIQILVAWWFLAKVVPVYYEVQLALGFPFHWPAALAGAISHTASAGAFALIPFLLIGNLAVCFATLNAGEHHRHRRWNLLLEVSLCALVFFALLAFARPLLIALTTTAS